MNFWIFTSAKGVLPMTKQILVEGPIDSGTASRVRKELASANGQPIEVRIFSEGGDVVPGFAIHQLFSEYRGAKSCIVDAAFSIASFIASAFPKCSIIQNGYLMMHDPYWEDAETQGEKSFLESLREKMVAGYASRSKKPLSTIANMMREETFLDSAQAVVMGFADAILPASPRLSISARYRAAMQAKSAEFGSHTGRIPLSAKSQWLSAVDAEYRKCGSRAKAVGMVERSHPGLRIRMIEEANKPTHRMPTSATSKVVACNSFGSPTGVLTNHAVGLTRTERREKLIDEMAWDAVRFKQNKR
jgi:ATP-dependent protease ClpP protease subunit